MSWCCEKCMNTIYDEEGNEDYPFQTDDGHWLCRTCYNTVEKSKNESIRNYIW